MENIHDGALYTTHNVCELDEVKLPKNIPGKILKVNIR